MALRPKVIVKVLPAEPKVIIHSQNTQDNQEDDKRNYNVNRFGLGINAIGVIINTILAIVALAVFGLTILQTRSALKSVSLAKQTLDSTIAFNNLTLKSQKEADEINEKRLKEKFDLDKESLKAQIEALNSAKSQFTIGNEPFLQLSNLAYSKLEVDKPVTTDLFVENLGNYPVKIISFKSITLPSEYVAESYLKEVPENSKYAGQYVIKGSPLSMKSTSKNLLNIPTYEAVNSEKYHIHLIGKIIYKNLISNKDKIYTFHYKLGKDGLYDILRSENDIYIKPE